LGKQEANNTKQKLATKEFPMKPEQQQKEWLTVEDVAEAYGVSVHTLNKWLVEGKGPKFSKMGRLIRYWRPDVDDWPKSQTRLSTSDPGQAVGGCFVGGYNSGRADSFAMPSRR
jgi:excisionase family DNA binding protein